jgi:release factor glutamine methyltransferase
MKIKGNQVSDIKTYFENELNVIYSKNEILVLFRMAAEHINGFSMNQLHLFPETRVLESELLQYSFFVKRLKNHEPVQYIIGYTWFTDLKIMVNESVLIPRPETEELVNCLLENNKLSNPRILDVCTGSGCIALALKHYITAAEVLACDISATALATAKNNADALSLNVAFYEADALTDPLEAFENLDFLITNPPYITFKEKATLAKNVTDYEPGLALFVPDDDALIFYKSISKWGKKLLNEGGMVLMECNTANVDDVAELLIEDGYSIVKQHADLSNLPRWVSAIK